MTWEPCLVGHGAPIFSEQTWRKVVERTWEAHTSALFPREPTRRGSGSGVTPRSLKPPLLRKAEAGPGSPVLFTQPAKAKA